MAQLTWPRTQLCRKNNHTSEIYLLKVNKKENNCTYCYYLLPRMFQHPAPTLLLRPILKNITLDEAPKGKTENYSIFLLYSIE